MKVPLLLESLYRHGGGWKFNPIEPGYFGGLAALCENFGIEIADDEKQTAPL